MTFSDPVGPGPVPADPRLGDTVPRGAAEPTPEPTLGALVHDLTQQLPQLVRAELRLAQAEVTEKGKRAGLGIGMFSAAGLLAYFGVAGLLTAAVLALDLVMAAWLAALVVAIVLLAAAALVALSGRTQVRRAAPPVPERAVEGVKQDIATIKGGQS